jgi:hypothetical protein
MLRRHVACRDKRLAASSHLSVTRLVSIWLNTELLALLAFVI